MRCSVHFDTGGFFATVAAILATAPFHLFTARRAAKEDPRGDEATDRVEQCVQDRDAKLQVYHHPENDGCHRCCEAPATRERRHVHEKRRRESCRRHYPEQELT